MKLILKLFKSSSIPTFVKIDGKVVKVKKIKNVPTVTVETNKPTVDVDIFTWSVYDSPLWFFSSIFYFIISVFGIFDIYENRKNQRINASFTFTLNREVNEVTLRPIPFREGEKAFSLESSCNYSENENIYTTDKKMRRRKKIMIFVKIALVVAAAIGAIFILK